MKLKYLLLAFLFFLFIGAFAQGSTADQNENAYQSYLVANKKMVKVYLKVYAGYEKYGINDDTQKAFVASQKAFLNYRNKIALLHEAEFSGGSMMTLFKYKALKKLTEDRIKQMVFYK